MKNECLFVYNFKTTPTTYFLLLLLLFFFFLNFDFDNACARTSHATVIVWKIIAVKCAFCVTVCSCICKMRWNTHTRARARATHAHTHTILASYSDVNVSQRIRSYGSLNICLTDLYECYLPTVPVRKHSGCQREKSVVRCVTAARTSFQLP